MKKIKDRKHIRYKEMLFEDKKIVKQPYKREKFDFNEYIEEQLDEENNEDLIENN